MDSPLGRFEPREVSTGEFPLWDKALALLNADLTATLPRQGPLRLIAITSLREDVDVPEDVHVVLSDGERHGNPLHPGSAADLAQALEAVADAAQETVSEQLWQAWPLCAEHGLGMHTRAADGRLSWWCAGERGLAHIRAAVGELDRSGSARDRRRPVSG